MQSDVTVRDARPSDYGFLCKAFKQANRLHLGLTTDFYREVDVFAPRWKLQAGIAGEKLPFFKGSRTLKIAEVNGEPVGAVYVESEKRSAASWSVHEKQANLDNIIVLETYRGRGVGKALLDAAED